MERVLREGLKAIEIVVEFIDSTNSVGVQRGIQLDKSFFHVFGKTLDVCRLFGFRLYLIGMQTAHEGTDFFAEKTLDQNCFQKFRTAVLFQKDFRGAHNFVDVVKPSGHAGLGHIAFNVEKTTALS